MDSLVETLMVLPLEAQALALFSLVVVAFTGRKLLQLRRVPPRSSPGLDPVLMPTSRPPRPRVAETPEIDTQRTLIPGASFGRPVEQIDLLSPTQDAPEPERTDPRVLESARRRVASTVARLGEPGPRDNLTAIRGLTPTHARTLQRLGVQSFAQLGRLTPDDLHAVSIVLEYPVDLIRSDDWIGQARAAGRARA